MFGKIFLNLNELHVYLEIKKHYSIFSLNDFNMLYGDITYGRQPHELKAAILNEGRKLFNFS